MYRCRLAHRRHHRSRMRLRRSLAALACSEHGSCSVLQPHLSCVLPTPPQTDEKGSEKNNTDRSQPAVMHTLHARWVTGQGGHRWTVQALQHGDHTVRHQTARIRRAYIVQQPIQPHLASAPIVQSPPQNLPRRGWHSAALFSQSSLPDCSHGSHGSNARAGSAACRLLPQDADRALAFAISREGIWICLCSV